MLKFIELTPGILPVMSVGYRELHTVEIYRPGFNRNTEYAIACGQRYCAGIVGLQVVPVRGGRAGQGIAYSSVMGGCVLRVSREQHQQVGSSDLSREYRFS